MLVSQKSTYFLIFIYIYIHTYTRLYGGKLLWIITVLFTEQFKYFFLLFPCISLAAGNQHECKCLFELACSCYCCSFMAWFYWFSPRCGPCAGVQQLFFSPLCTEQFVQWAILWSLFKACCAVTYSALCAHLLWSSFHKRCAPEHVRGEGMLFHRQIKCFLFHCL